jgi:hypothetical protein
VFVDNTDYQEVVDQEGTVVASDEFPKRPRKKAKKAAALAAREAAARAEAGDTNSAEEKDEDEKETDGTSKSNVGDDIMKDADDTENKGEEEGEEEGEATPKDDSGSPSKAVECSLEENTGAGTTEENVGGAMDDNADEDIAEENAGEGPTEDNPEGSKPGLLLDYNQKTPAVRAITEEELDSIKIEDIVLPLPGHNVVYPNNVIKEWYEELLAVDGLSFSAMKQNVR